MKESLTKKYKNLLLSDVSNENLDKSLSLLREVCTNTINFNLENNYYLFIPFIPELEQNNNILKVWIENKQLYNKNEKINDTIFELFIALNLLPDFIVSNPKSVKDDDYSFIMDITQIIFHNSYFSFLDQFDKDQQSKHLLIKVFLNYTRYLDYPSDVFYIRSLCYDYLDKKELSRQLAYNSILASHPDNHEFMTLIQNYWAGLLEEGLFDEAIKFLIEIKARILLKDIEEFDQLIILTFNYLKKKFVSTPSGG